MKKKNSQNEAIDAVHASEWKTKVFELHVVEGTPMIITDYKQKKNTGSMSVFTGNATLMICKMTKLLEEAV